MKINNTNFSEICVTDKVSVLPNMFNYVFTLDSDWWDWHGNGTLSFDEQDKLFGNASMRIDCASNGSLCGFHRDFSTMNMSNLNFHVYVKSSDWSKVSTARIIFFTSAGNYFACNFINKIADLNSDWKSVFLTRDDFSVEGSPSWNSITKIIISGAAVSGQEVTLKFDQLVCFAQGAQTFVSIVFDDGYSSVYTTAKPLMDNHNFSGSIYLIPDYVNQSGGLSLGQLKEFQTTGWDIASHSDYDLTTLSASSLYSELARVKRINYQNGFSACEHFAYPYGKTNKQVIEAVGKFFKTGRGVEDFSNPTSWIEPMSIHSMQVLNTTTVASVQSRIDQAVSAKEWLVLTFHKIVSSPSASTEYSTSNFSSILSYLKNSGVSVLPISSVLKKLS